MAKVLNGDLPLRIEANREDELLAALREQMQEEIEGVSRQAHGVKARLERLEKSNSASLAREGCGPGSSTERSRSAITAALRKKLRDLMGEDFFWFWRGFFLEVARRTSFFRF